MSEKFYWYILGAPCTLAVIGFLITIIFLNLTGALFVAGIGMTFAYGWNWDKVVEQSKILMDKLGI